MREPAPTFRASLKLLQDWIRSLSPGWKRRLARDVVANWVDHDDCESIWQTIRSTLKIEPLPDRFAAGIVLIRLDSEALVKIKRADFKADMLACTEQLLQEGKHTDLADRFADFTEATLFERERDRARQHGLISKKQTARSHFMRTLSGGFARWSKDGRPHDDLVRQLTDIAFGGETDNDAVRWARKPRTRS